MRAYLQRTAINTALLIKMRETYAPVIQESLLRHSPPRLDDPSIKPSPSSPSLPTSPPLPPLLLLTLTVPAVSKSAAARAILLRALQRPLRLITNPVVLIFSVYYAFVYGVLFLSLIMVCVQYFITPYTLPTNLDFFCLIRL